VSEQDHPPTIGGTWRLEVQPPFAEATFDLTVEGDGDDVRAALRTDAIGTLELTLVALEDTHLAGTAAVQGALLRLDVTLSGETLTGTLATPQYSAPLIGRRGSA
jgi:hypothetical protein